MMRRYLAKKQCGRRCQDAHLGWHQCHRGPTDGCLYGQHSLCLILAQQAREAINSRGMTMMDPDERRKSILVFRISLSSTLVGPNLKPPMVHHFLVSIRLNVTCLSLNLLSSATPKFRVVIHKRDKGKV